MTAFDCLAQGLASVIIDVRSRDEYLEERGVTALL